MRFPLVVPLALLLAGVLAPAAKAATVSVETSSSGTVYINVAGGPEADVLTVSSPSADRFVVTQAPGLPLTESDPSCAVVGAGRVYCVANAAGALLVGAAGNDQLAISGPVGLGAWLFGGNGADALTGGPGADRLDGGAGADVLHAADGREDELICGSEADAFDADALDTVALDCEQRVVVPAPADPPVTSPDPGPAPLPGPLPTPLPPGPPPVDVVSGTATLRHGSVPLRVSCGAAASCSGWITIRLLPRRSGKATAARSRRPVIAKRRYRLAAGQTKSLRAHISRRGRQRVLERRRARCSVRISTVAADGAKQVSSSRITIKAGGKR